MTAFRKSLKYRGRVIFEKVRMPKFKRVPKSSSEDEACFMFLEGGEFMIRSSTKILAINKQSALLAKCTNYFFELQDYDKIPDDSYCEALGVMLYPSVISELFDFRRIQDLQKKVQTLQRIDIDPLLLNFKESISYLIDHPEIADEELIQIKLKEFVNLIMKQNQDRSISDFFSLLFDPVVHEMEETISANLLTNLTIDDLAFLCNMSTSTFKRRFQAVYETSPRKYILDRKIEHACNLLTKKDVKISEVAYDCGFEDLSTFNRNFKKIIGSSPSEFVLALK